MDAGRNAAQRPGRLIFNEHEIHAFIDWMFRKMQYSAPPFSVSEAMIKLFPEVEVTGGTISDYAKIDIYREPRSDGIKATITYNERSHHSTHRFSILHELAHFLWDAERGARFPDGDVCSARPDAKSLSERRADYFASEYLAPLWHLDGSVKISLTPDPDDDDGKRDLTNTAQRLASRYNVSLACMRSRLRDLIHWRHLRHGR